MSSLHRASEPLSLTATAKLKAFQELTKPRITILILMVAVASFYVASPAHVNLLRLLYAVLGIGLLGSGIFALNHYLERDVDALMRRTAGRPLPTGRLKPNEALVFGIMLTAIALTILAAGLNPLSGFIGLFTFASYVLVYTPLKRHTPYHTPLGALSGATPPLLGWAAASGTLGVDAWILFGILFLWQFPHFLAIEMMYSEDYARAGIRVLPVVDPTWKKVGIELLLALVLLLGVGILPFVTGLAGELYLIGAALSGIAFLVAGVRAVHRKEKLSSRQLLLTSVFYLPLVFGLLVLNVK
ncbi:MAG TPA: heme o synthase [Spirochaetia bacterium]|nr:heme o synthase [Spirochaetia bacterium]